MLCDIREFTSVTECLDEDIMVFVNKIAFLVHSFTHNYHGIFFLKYIIVDHVIFFFFVLFALGIVGSSHFAYVLIKKICLET